MRGVHSTGPLHPAAIAALVCLTGGQAWATGEARPEFATCIDTQVAYFERDYPPMTQTGGEAGFQNGLFDWVDYCGMVGIIDCDYAEDPLECQRTLRADLDGMRNDILAGLPAPTSVTGRAGEWSDELYPRVWALANGFSAGEDCAGTQDAFGVWCEAREATGRLKLAILAWQIARYLNAAEPAVVAGWAAPPPPMRPRARPERGD